MALTFYTNPMSRGRIVRWMLEELGIEYDTVVLDYASSMKNDAYLAVNPMGKVPAIVHDGKVVTEGAAICAYLAETFPKAGLAPTAAERADYYRWMFYAAGPVEAAITNRSLGVVPTAEQQRTVGYGSYETMVNTFASAVAAHPYFTGNRFTAVDVYAGSQVVWGVRFGSLPKLPVFEDYAARVTSRDAYKRASAIDDALIKPQG
jgi:glutathione S-transferase